MGRTPDAADLDREGPIPLWSQLYEDLVRRIEAGEFAESFPGEMEISEQYRVSRHTARAALRQVRDRGLVVFGRGRAPRVAVQSEIDQPLGALYSLFASVEAAGLEQRSIVRKLRPVLDAEAAERLGLRASDRLVHLERLRMAGGEPLALDRAWLPFAVAAPLLEVDFTRTALYAELAARCGVRLSGGTERLRAVRPSPALRRVLGLNADGAAFSIERVAMAGGDPVEWRHTHIRGDRFVVSADFSAHQGYQLGVSGTDLPANSGGDGQEVTPRSDRL
ncbi:GntR family transcriptional regulator [Nonomuraea insulae]|uniref:GntR family transcriptional regulator n=1 Tax=Nonomuraea insulae TaxID=1616787 RepID=A0ABW1DCP3_9ACTN